MKTNTETLYEIIEHHNKLIITKDFIIEEKDKQIKNYQEIIDDLNNKIDKQLEMLESLTGNSDSMVLTNQALIKKIKELQDKLNSLTKISDN